MYGFVSISFVLGNACFSFNRRFGKVDFAAMQPSLWLLNTNSWSSFQHHFPQYQVLISRVALKIFKSVLADYIAKMIAKNKSYNPGLALPKLT
jgi:hypothetical protein